MARIEVSNGDDGKVVVHASSQVINQLAIAFSLMLPKESYDVFRSEDGADLVASRSDFDAVLAANPALNNQFTRDTTTNVAKSAMVL
jgi:hypothetical protein